MAKKSKPRDPFAPKKGDKRSNKQVLADNEKYREKIDRKWAVKSQEQKIRDHYLGRGPNPNLAASEERARAIRIIKEREVQARSYGTDIGRIIADELEWVARHIEGSLPLT